MTTPDKAIELIRQRLEDAFIPSRLEIIDESHHHAGHAGAQSGKGHYALNIASAAFTGKTPIMRHRMIFQVLDELMETHIHALSISAKTK